MITVDRLFPSVLETVNQLVAEQIHSKVNKKG